MWPGIQQRPQHPLDSLATTAIRMQQSRLRARGRIPQSAPADPAEGARIHVDEARGEALLHVEANAVLTAVRQVVPLVAALVAKDVHLRLQQLRRWLCRLDLSHRVGGGRKAVAAASWVALALLHIAKSTSNCLVHALQSERIAEKDASIEEPEGRGGLWEVLRNIGIRGAIALRIENQLPAAAQEVGYNALEAGEEDDVVGINAQQEVKRVSPAVKTSTERYMLIRQLSRSCASDEQNARGPRTFTGTPFSAADSKSGLASSRFVAKVSTKICRG